MVQLSGTYENGNIKLDKKIAIDKPVRVLVTFMDEDVSAVKEKLTLDDFSFSRSRKLLKDVHTNLSDVIIEERRLYL